MADVKQAMKWIEQRKSVRRGCWIEGAEWQPYGKTVFDTTCGEVAEVYPDDILAEDWEIVDSCPPTAQEDLQVVDSK